jgi:dTDP-4-dehydrorhamnose 3,5-epimerase
MFVRKTPLADLLVIELKVHGDARGFFVERFHEERFALAGLPTHFAQDNHSRSAPRILRGLHYQHSPAQGKLVGAISGKIWDVAVDIRPQSPTYGRHFGIELSGENGLLLWVPGGFAHGFCVLGDEPSDLLYKVTAPYNPAGEGGIRFDDPALGIDWPVEEPLISERDRNLPSFVEYKAKPVQWK